jgi:hypothetical protein
LKRCLEPERARLEAMRQLELDASTWSHGDRNGMFLNHRGKRLTETAALVQIEQYKKRITEEEVHISRLVK